MQTPSNRPGRPSSTPPAAIASLRGLPRPFWQAVRRQAVCAAMLLAATAGFSGAAHAHDARIGGLHILHPAAPATLPGQRSGAVYLAIDNEGAAADRLLSATTPAAAGVSIHAMAMDGAIMRMREIDGLPLPPSRTVSLKADSGHHLMLTGLKQPMKAGDRIPLTLIFERAGKLEVSVHVEPNAAQAGTASAGKATGETARPAAAHAH